jgi:hypothetical protein
MAGRFSEYLEHNDLYQRYQFAYRRHHSTETALTRLMSDLIMGVNSGEIGLMSVLDMSAAFDTVDHGVLLRCLDEEYGVRGAALDWMRSYLEGRRCTVRVRSEAACEEDLTQGVPQGSVLGPVLFILYTAYIDRLVESNGFLNFTYADDRVIVKFCRPEEREALISDTVRLIENLSAVMAERCLKLNPSKTEFMWVASPRRQNLLDDRPICVSGVDIVPSKCVTVLGVAIDSALSMESQVARVVRSAFYYIRQIRHVSSNLPQDAIKALMSALVASRLDYCNIVYVGLPKIQLDRLQAAFNAAARVVFDERRTCHITPLLESLHWLKVDERIDFKLCLMVYKAINHLTPQCLADLCTLDTTQRRPLRSAATSVNKLTEVNRNNMSRFFERAFAVAGPVRWNKLPVEVREDQSMTSFRKKMKTALFSKSFPRP